MGIPYLRVSLVTTRCIPKDEYQRHLTVMIIGLAQMLTANEQRTAFEYA